MAYPGGGEEDFKGGWVGLQLGGHVGEIQLSHPIQVQTRLPQLIVHGRFIKDHFFDLIGPDML